MMITAKRMAAGFAVVVGLLLALAAPANATWSVVGVDPDAGEVGVAVASCVPIEALDTEARFELIALVGGKGAGVSQALFNDAVPEEMERLLAADNTAAQIISSVTDATFDEGAEDRQHAVVLLTGEAVGFTGKENSDFAGDRQGTNVSAQGNILVSEQVLIDAVATFEASDGRPLADRLVDALEAGSLAGGDSRCGDQTALFAHVSVIDAEGDSAAPNVLQLTAWSDEGDGTNPVTQMAQSYRDGARFSDPLSATLPLLAVVGLLAIGVIGVVALVVAITAVRRR